MHHEIESIRRLTPAVTVSAEPSGEFIHLDGRLAYRIGAYHRLDPFLINLASDVDLWMFITSRGGLTAGRIDADGSLFPYLTSDQLQDAHRHTGPMTLLRLERQDGPPELWEPFSETSAGDPGIERNLYKSASGNQIIFEEAAHGRGLVFRYRWAGCDEYGWVRTATLENRGAARARIHILDGLRNVLPWGAPLILYQQASNLVNAYKKSGCDPATGLGIFSLTAGITDRPEALEMLRANAVWCCGLTAFRTHLSLASIDAFRQGQLLPAGPVLNGKRGNYFVSATLDLEPGEKAHWHLAADVGRDHVQLSKLQRALRKEANLYERIERSLQKADENLRRIVASADGLQLTGQPQSSGHHFANVLFNNMRGGVFLDDDQVPVADFTHLLSIRNRAVADRHKRELAKWSDRVPVGELRRAARESGDRDFARLSHEYLPLHFGRRHGDPSRPWNRFEIRLRDRNGKRVLHYEGNWRDIFQNWEALGRSFPSFLPNMVARFVSASTVDGFNPYRITQEGVDWEVPSSDDPWSNIGYWGDHQIVYLLRLLEAMDAHEPSALPALLAAEIFSYADVPYRIKPYEEILHDPRATIEFDIAREHRIEERIARLGTDGRLLPSAEGGIYHANLFEKLLVPALSKLSNLIPGAGIWMNTQRPEWNDANNALGGGSVSVVTLCHLRRYLEFLAAKLEAAAPRELAVATEIAQWFDRIAAILETESAGTGDADPRERKRIMDALGGAFSEYREAVYAHGLSGQRNLAIGRCAAFCRRALEWTDLSIAANRRDDGLYHTYNQLAFSADFTSVTITRLQEMLEGQVAILSSGAVPPAECLAMLEALFASALYRAPERSFMLYPERELPGFMAKNVIPEDGISAIPLLREMERQGNRSLWARDTSGAGRFHGDIRSAHDLAAILDDLAEESLWSAAVTRDRAAVLDLFERVFEHRRYTGRSAAMYSYEGIGCIYWHMIGKLLLAVQETTARAERAHLPAATRRRLAEMYFRVQSGLGHRKTVTEFGAVPTDPYSHTPPSGGAKQPGMTGQVKEEIIARLGELGVIVASGEIHFQPHLLPADELLAEPAEFSCFDLSGRERTLPLRAGSLAFTFCQVPIIYEQTEDAPWVRVTFADGSSRDIAGAILASDLADGIFQRSGAIDHIRVGIPAGALWRD